MSQYEQQGQERDQIRVPAGTTFEGGHQETVEVLPSIDELTPEEREQGVIARVGRDRVERRLREGQPPEAGIMSTERLREDALMGVTYTVAGYFTLVIVFICMAIVAGWLVVLNVGA